MIMRIDQNVKTKIDPVKSTYQQYVENGDLDAAAVFLEETGVILMQPIFMFDPSRVTADWNGQVRVTPQVLWVDSFDDHLWEWQTPEPDDQPGRWLVEAYDGKYDGWIVYCSADNESVARIAEAGLLHAWTQICLDLDQGEKLKTSSFSPR